MAALLGDGVGAQRGYNVGIANRSLLPKVFKRFLVDVTDFVPPLHLTFFNSTVYIKNIMADISALITETQERLARYIAAEQYLLQGGQAYSIGNRSLTRADLKHITQMIIRLRSDLARLEQGNQITQHRIVPRDI